LPNITGDTGWVRSADSQTGAFETGTISKMVFNNNGNTTNYSTHFNASRSSSTYQDDAPVQQEALCIVYIIKF